MFVECTFQQDYNATCRSYCKSRTLCDQMYAKAHVVTPIAKVHLVIPFAKAHPVLCIEDKFSIDLVKIWRKSVDWLKTYSKNQYLGPVDLLFKN